MTDSDALAARRRGWLFDFKAGARVFRCELIDLGAYGIEALFTDTLSVLPARLADARTSHERRRRLRQPEDTWCDVLLVDDDVGFVGTSSALLRRHGCSVIAEFTYDSALRYLTSHTPDALITDIRLGADSGWDLVRHARQHQPRMPVIVVTGWAGEIPHKSTGVVVFDKPCDIADLLDYLREAIFGR